MEILRASASGQISESFLITDYRPLIPESDRSPLHDVRQRAPGQVMPVRRIKFLNERVWLRRVSVKTFFGQSVRLRTCSLGQACVGKSARLEVWWSQTGSNRRPPACKAGALPTELWPRQDQISVIGDHNSLVTG